MAVEYLRWKKESADPGGIRTLCLLGWMDFSGGGPLAADGGDYGAFLFEGGHGFVHYLAVKSREFGYLSRVERFAGLAHCVQYYIFFVHDQKNYF